MVTGYPIVLTQIRGARAVVVGGGPVGERKVHGLLAVGADVLLVSPAATPALQARVEGGEIEWQRRPYRPGDLEGALLALAATNRRALNARVAAEAAARGILCNVADAPAEGDFHLPAVYRGDGLLVTVSSGGESAGRSRRMRDRIAAWLKEEVFYE